MFSKSKVTLRFYALGVLFFFITKVRGAALGAEPDMSSFKEPNTFDLLLLSCLLSNFLSFSSSVLFPMMLALVFLTLFLDFLSFFCKYFCLFWNCLALSCS